MIALAHPVRAFLIIVALLVAANLVGGNVADLFGGLLDALGGAA